MADGLTQNSKLTIKNWLLAALAVMALMLIPWIGTALLGITPLFGIVIPYLAVALFVVGFVYRIVGWASSPVPFHVPTVCGQQKSLSWIKPNNLESPTTNWGLFGRMALEVLFFRTLWRNDKVELKRSEKLVFGSNRYLWLGGMLFHWSLAVILFRHLRFFTEPVFPGVAAVQHLDTLFQIGLPALYITDVLIAVALVYLLFRRFLYPQLKLISLPADYFALFLLIAIAGTGMAMRHVVKIDIEAAKQLVMGVVTFQPAVVRDIGSIFYIHLFLVSILLAYFPFSKLMHAPGVFLSPTRNLKNNSRAVRHINPWNPKVDVHTYEEWEDEFRDAMIEAGLPVEKQQREEGEEHGA